MGNVSERSYITMYKLFISNDNLSTELQTEDFKGVMQLINTFKKRYGEPIFIQVLLLNEKEKEVDNN